MSKDKVVPIAEFLARPGGPTLLAKDETLIGGVRDQRFVLKMFEQRIAFDFISRAIRLPPETAPKPIPFSVKNRPKRKTKRDPN